MKLRGLLISSFNVRNLANCLNSELLGPEVDCQVAPFGQVVPIFLKEALEERSYDFSVVWTQPEAVIDAFAKVISTNEVQLEVLLEQVNEFAEQLLSFSKTIGCVLVSTWSSTWDEKNFTILNDKNNLGLNNILLQMNLHLVRRLSVTDNIFFFDPSRWISSVSFEMIRYRFWYVAKVPYDSKVFVEAAKAIKSTLVGIHGGSRKLILLDLDDTLWGGIVGEVGMEGLELGGHHPNGEAFLDFQRLLKSYLVRGVLLGIVSKNDEKIALSTIEKHQEMILRKNDFVGWKINWKEKALNIVELVETLNLGLQSVVFIDNNISERARVRESLPEVLVPDWPDDPTLYPHALRSLGCFNPPSLSDEDQRRTAQYQEEYGRIELKNRLRSVDEWLIDLEINVWVEELNDQNILRTIQLFNKTNQMNLSSRRMTENELINWVTSDLRKIWVFRVSDRFGDYGLCGISSIEFSGETATIVDFVLSCRAMGRKIEETMVSKMVDYASTKKAKVIVAYFLPSPRNQPCLDFWERSGFERGNRSLEFIWQLSREFPLPDNVKLIQRDK